MVIEPEKASEEIIFNIVLDAMRCGNYLNCIASRTRDRPTSTKSPYTYIIWSFQKGQCESYGAIVASVSYVLPILSLTQALLNEMADERMIKLLVYRPALVSEAT